MLDYAKMKLDQKLKQVFISSQYSLKCLKSFNNCEINTLKVLEEDEEQKSLSSNDQQTIEQFVQSSKNSYNKFQSSEKDQLKFQQETNKSERQQQINHHQYLPSNDIKSHEIQRYRVNQQKQFLIGKQQKTTKAEKSISFQKLCKIFIQNQEKQSNLKCFNKNSCNAKNNQSKYLSQKSYTTSFISLLCQFEPLSVKETCQIGSWIRYSSKYSTCHQNILNQTCMKQMQKTYQKLIGKQNLSFQEQGMMYLTNNNKDQSDINITAFMIGESNGSISEDCCIGQTSFNSQDCNNDEGMIIQSGEQLVGQQIIEDSNKLSYKNNLLNDCICEEQDVGINQDGIIQDKQQQQQQNQYKIQNTQQIYTNQMNIAMHIQYQQDANSIIKMRENIQYQMQINKNSLQQQSNIQQQSNNDLQNNGLQQQIGTDGSIQFTSSIKTLQNIQQNQSYKPNSSTHHNQTNYYQIASQQINQHQHIAVNSQIRQYHYTIDNLTQSNNHANNANITNQSLVDTLSNQPSIISSPSEIVSKQSIFTLIEEYTLNPQILKVIKVKIKKISNSQLKKLQTLSHGQLRDQIQKQMRIRGMFVSLNTSNFDNQTSGSLFSISNLVNQSFQIDQSKFYATNYKKCEKKVKQKKKMDEIPILRFKQWKYFVFEYIFKRKQKQYDNINQKKVQQASKGSQLLCKTSIQLKNLSDLLIKLVLVKQNLLLFFQILLNLLSFKTIQQIIKFGQLDQKQLKQISMQNNVNSQHFIKQMTSIILNDLISKMIINRIGLPVIFKAKWNHQTKKLIRYQFQCLFSDSNLNQNQNHDQSLLQLFLTKTIQLIYFNNHVQLSSNNQSKIVKYPTADFIKNIQDYFKNTSNFQSNQFPYYYVQDSVKLTSSNNPKNNLPLYRHSINQKNNKINKYSRLTQTLLNAMKQSSNQSLKQYQQIFSLMNYLDFETFSQFLEILIQTQKPLCEKILDKQLNIIKRFKKSINNTDNLSKQKLAELYWHMRKSSKLSLSSQYQQKQLNFFTRIISIFSSSIYLKFKQSIFRFGYGKQQNKRKQKLSHLNKLLMNPSYETRYKSIKSQIQQLQKQYLLWKTNKTTEILKEDILPIVQKISSSFNDCLKKWESFFQELYQIFGNERQQKIVIYKQCAEFYKIFLSFQLLLQSQQTALMRSMSSLKTKPSLESSKDMFGVTGRRRSSLTLPRVSLTYPPQTTFKSVIKSIAPKFSFFFQMIESTCSQLKIHSKYSTIESKLKLLHQPNKGGDLTIQVKRQSIWQDTLPYLNDEFGQKNIKIKIHQEIGLDYGGIRRQWITLIVKELINPNLGLFELSVNGLSFQPSSISHLIPNHLYHFHKFGILVGKALKQNWLLQINFTKSFLKHLLGFTLYVQDLEDIDPQTTKGLLWILNNDVGMDGQLGIDYTYEYMTLGKKNTIQLIQNGRQLLVNDQNKKQYVKKLAYFKMTEKIRQQSKAFISGVQKIVPYDVLKLFSYKELGIYLSGMPTADVEEMKKYARYEGFSKQNQSIEWFWKTLSTYTQQQKANFLFFLTGSYKVPYGGFKQNPICINKMPASKDYLPVAHTCFSVIDLPQYTSYDKLALLLDKAISQGKGFSVS